MTDTENAKRWEQLETKLADMEMRIAFQDDLMETLDNQMADQEQAMRRLWDANRILRQRVETLQEAEMQENGEEAPPPHY